MEESGSHQPTIGPHQDDANLHQAESGGILLVSIGGYFAHFRDFGGILVILWGLGVVWLFFGFWKNFGHFLGFGGILVILWVLGGILVIFRFQGYFGYFFGF